MWEFCVPYPNFNEERVRSEICFRKQEFEVIFLALDAIDAVRHAELQAEETTRSASSSATQMLSDAEKQAAEIVGTAKDEARKLAEETALTSQQESSKVLEKASAALASEMQAFREKALAAQGDAVQAVLKALV